MRQPGHCTAASVDDLPCTQDIQPESVTVVDSVSTALSNAAVLLQRVTPWVTWSPGVRKALVVAVRYCLRHAGLFRGPLVRGLIALKRRIRRIDRRKSAMKTASQGMRLQGQDRLAERPVFFRSSIPPSPPIPKSSMHAPYGHPSLGSTTCVAGCAKTVCDYVTRNDVNERR